MSDKHGLVEKRNDTSSGDGKKRNKLGDALRSRVEGSSKAGSSAEITPEKNILNHYRKIEEDMKEADQATKARNYAEITLLSARHQKELGELYERHEQNIQNVKNKFTSKNPFKSSWDSYVTKETSKTAREASASLALEKEAMMASHTQEWKETRMRLAQEWEKTRMRLALDGATSKTQVSGTDPFADLDATSKTQVSGTDPFADPFADPSGSE